MKNKKAVLVFSLMAVAIFGIAALAWLSGRNQPSAEDTSGSIKSLVPTDVLTLDHALLRWSAGPPGTVYDIDVSTTDMKPIAHGSALTVPEFVIPQTSFYGLTPGKSIGWIVRATLPDGKVVSSPMYVNTVRKN